MKGRIPRTKKKLSKKKALRNHQRQWYDSWYYVSCNYLKAKDQIREMNSLIKHLTGKEYKI